LIHTHIIIHICLIRNSNYKTPCYWSAPLSSLHGTRFGSIIWHPPFSSTTSPHMILFAEFQQESKTIPKSSPNGAWRVQIFCWMISRIFPVYPLYFCQPKAIRIPSGGFPSPALRQAEQHLDLLLQLHQRQVVRPETLDSSGNQSHGFSEKHDQSEFNQKKTRHVTGFHWIWLDFV
jgi:hypothetical protein